MTGLRPLELCVKFKHKIIVISSLVLLLALTVLSVKQYFSLKNNLETQVEQSVSEIIQGISNTVTAQMQGSADLASLTTDLVAEVGSLDEAAPLLGQRKLQQEFILIGYGEERTGKYVASDPSWNPGPTWDPRKRPWYQDAKNANKLIVTAPYADSVSKEILVSIGTPVKKSGQFHGAIFFGAAERGEHAAAAPHADEEIHGQYCEFVEEEKEEHIQGNEHAEDPREQ